MYIDKPRTDMLPACVRCMYLNTPVDEQPCNECYGLFFSAETRGRRNSPGGLDRTREVEADLIPDRKRTPAEVALAEIEAAMSDYKTGKTGRLTLETAVKNAVDKYNKAESEPIPYELTRKAGVSHD